MLDTVLAEKASRSVQVFSALTKRALDELQPLKADAEKAAGDRPALLDSLVAAGAIEEHQKEAAAAKLSTHAGTAELLKQAAMTIQKLAENQKEASDLGVGVDPSLTGGSGTSKAGFDSLTSPFVGRQTSEKKASDEAYRRGLGIS